MKLCALELEKRNEEHDSFAYAASHDLRAPVRTISYLAGWIEDESKELLPSTSVKHLDDFKGRLNRLDRLLVDLLAYSRIGRLELKRELIDCRKLIQEIRDDEIDSEQFEFEVSDFMPTFETCVTPLVQVLRNLIGNTIKHYPHECTDRTPGISKRGKIRITCQPDGEYYRFAVSDDGAGIPQKYHNKIFEVFQTLQPRDQVEGSGIGLSIVRKAIESQGESNSVFSTEGIGTTFEFTWPRA